MFFRVLTFWTLNLTTFAVEIPIPEHIRAISYIVYTPTLYIILCCITCRFMMMTI